MRWQLKLAQWNSRILSIQTFLALPFFSSLKINEDQQINDSSVSGLALAIANSLDKGDEIS